MPPDPRPAWAAYLPSGISPPGARDIEEALTAAIRAGDLLAGEQLPSERTLSAMMGVSRDTLRRALEGLLTAGLVQRKVGRGGGTFVSAAVVEHAPSQAIGFWQSLRAQGVQAGTRVLQARLKPAGAVVCEHLGIALGDPVYELQRMRLNDGDPLSLELTQLSAARFPGLLEQPLGGSLCDLLAERYAAPAVRAVERLAPATATEHEAAVLETHPGAPLMRIERVTYLADDVPMAYDIDLFRGDRTRVVVESEGRGLSASKTKAGVEDFVLIGHSTAG